MFTTLIGPAELAALLETGNCVVLDCRYSLTDSDAGLQQYREEHIPGAQYADLTHDLSSPIIENQSSRHPLPMADTFVQCLRSWGVSNDTQVVAYDDIGGAMASRAWWLCRWTGHEASAVLNGGINSWRKENLPLSAETHSAIPGNATIRNPLASLITADEVLEPDRFLIDARAYERYSGKIEPLDKIAGHIPGALNCPFNNNLNAAGEFLSVADLQQRYQSLITDHATTEVTHYCGSGVTATHNILAMLHAGFGMTTLYAGSWSEWVQDDRRPVATGPD